MRSGGDLKDIWRRSRGVQQTLCSSVRSGGCFCPSDRVPHQTLGQNVAPLAAPDHQHHHGQREEDGDEDEEHERVVRRVDEHVLQAAVGEEVLVDADDEVLHRRVRPEAADALGVHLRAEGEDVILSEERSRNITLLVIRDPGAQNQS